MFKQMRAEPVAQPQPPAEVSAPLKTATPIAEAFAAPSPAAGMARHFARAALEFHVLNPGLQSWTAGIENLRISYAAYAPESDGETQQHAAAVIMYVINGECLVETGGTVITVGKGEVIAIPAQAPYRTFTREQAALTITAWTSGFTDQQPGFSDQSSITIE
jgi:mannose-6-phosphate isomerase-like protein (cupin superfamily)